MKISVPVRSLFFCFLLCNGLQSSAQKIGVGVSLGYNLSKPTNMQVWADNFNRKLGWEKSIRPTILMTFPLNNHMALQSEIALVDQGKRLSLKSFHAGDSIWNGTVMREKVNFVKFNQMISFDMLLNEKYRLSLLAECGPYFARFVSYTSWVTEDKICAADGEINMRKYDFPDSNLHYTQLERRSQFGMVAGLGLKKKTTSGSFFINFRYEQAFTNNSRDFPAFDLSLFRLHRVMAFSVGYIFDTIKLHKT
jgi:hypothetical protein